MATVGSFNLTLSDIAKMSNPKGDIADLVNLLSQRNEIVQDMTYQECNDGTSHQTTIVTGLPQGAWVRYNEGRAPSKGATAQIKAQTGILEMPIVIDKYLAEKKGPSKVGAIRMKQAMLGIEGLEQQMATALFYEDERTNPERITGLSPHYSTVSTATAASAENVVDCQGTGSDNMSVWIIGWGDGKISGLLPEGAGVGITREDRGVVDVVDTTGVAGRTFAAYKEVLAWRLGLVVEDWRYGVRLCNIDVSNLRANAGSQADLWNRIIEGIHRIPNLSSCKPAIYGNRTFQTWLRIQALTKSAYQTTFEKVEGKPVTMIQGVPVRTCDALLNTEARIV